MNVFSTYFAREWREHRSALALCIVFSAGLSVWIATYLDEFTVRVETVPLFAVAQAICLYLFVVGGSLLGSGERNTPPLFERMPRGLSAAFFAKTAFFYFGLILSGAAGLSGLYFGSLALVGFVPNFDQGLHFTWSALLLAAPVLTWSLAASSWVPRSALALPLGICSLALLAWPYLLMAVMFGEHFVLEMDQSVVFSCVMTLAAFPAALVGYRMARSTSSREALAGAATILVGSAFALPSWTWIVVSRPSIPRSLEWSGESHSPMAFAGPGGEIYWGWEEAGPIPWQSSVGGAFYRLNEATGIMELVAAQEYEGLVGGPILEGLRPSARGSRGYAYLLSAGGESEWHYCDAQFTYDFTLHELFGDSAKIEDHPQVWIGGDQWVIRASSDAPLRRFDPATGTRSELDWPHSDGSRGFGGLMLHDGRFLLSSERRLFLGDPRDGSSEEVQLPQGPWGFLFFGDYLSPRVQLMDTRPVVLQVGASFYVLEGDRLVTGPCLLQAEQPYLFGFREREGRREFLWQSWTDGTIWSSDVDSPKVLRLFPR